MSSVTLLSFAEGSAQPALQTITNQAVASSNDASNVFLGPNNDKPNTVYEIPNQPHPILRALDTILGARVAELRSAGRDADAAELQAATDATKPIQAFAAAALPPPTSHSSSPVASVTECRHFRLAATRLLWAFLTNQPTVALLPASAPLPLRDAAEQLVAYAASHQPTTHASLDAGAAFSTCAKWVYADDRAALLAALRAGSGAPLQDSEKPKLARLVFQILLLDNQAARRHGFSSEPGERALGATTDVFPALDEVVACANVK